MIIIVLIENFPKNFPFVDGICSSSFSRTLSKSTWLTASGVWLTIGVGSVAGICVTTGVGSAVGICGTSCIGLSGMFFCFKFLGFQLLLGEHFRLHPIRCHPFLE